MAFLDPVLNPIFQPLLNVSPFWTIVVLSFLISLVITLVYKYFTNQGEMKSLKGKQKEFQKRMKELRDKPEEMMRVQKEAMQVNMQYMKHSLKPTLITMIPILLIFGWMAAHMSYEPIFPDERYSITASFAEGVSGTAELIPDEGTTVISDVAQQINSHVTWNLKSAGGTHNITIKTDSDQQTKEVLVTNEVDYKEPVSAYQNSDITKIEVKHNKLRPLGPNFSLFGWQPGWLGLYVILSIVFSMALRKLMKLH